MKKILFVFMSLLLVVGITGCEKTKKVTLADVAEKFNNSETVKAYKEYGMEIKAEAKENELVVTEKMGEEEVTTTFKLDGNVLSNEKLTDDELMAAMILVDSVGELHGYKSGEVAENLNAFADDYAKYTVEKEGFEFKENDETVSIKVDITKKMPLKDMSEFYLKVEDFDMISDMLERETNGNQSGKSAKMSYNVFLGEEESEIVIGEVDKLTKSAYKSVLSALEVMYGKEVVKYFQEKYPEFKTEKTTFDGFVVETDYKVEDQEESVFTGAKVVKVTINNEYIKNNF